MISKQTATDIALAYREVEAAEALLESVVRAHKNREVPDIRDAFGRLQSGLQLGVPSGNSSHRLYDVPWTLVQPVLEALIAMHRSKIQALSQKARHEIEREIP